MQKVKLPRDVAEAIEKLRNMDFKVTNSDIIYAFAASKSGEYPALINFASDNFDTLLRALVNDYEIEETPEEKAIQWLIKRKCLVSGFSEHDIVMAIKSILEKGVNDHE